MISGATKLMPPPLPGVAPPALLLFVPDGVAVTDLRRGRISMRNRGLAASREASASKSTWWSWPRLSPPPEERRYPLPRRICSRVSP